MTIIAVAGGNGHLGKTVVRELLSQPKYEVIILTRKTTHAGESKAREIEVDYSDVPSLTAILERHQVHTVISTIEILKSKNASDMQINLIKAAGSSAATKRFVPSEFSIDNKPEYVDFAPNVSWFLSAIEALRQTDLEYTRILLGFFIDYYGMPHIETELSPYKYGLDIEAREAVIPGTGDDAISMIYTKDFAALLVAALDLGKWEETYAVIGETTTFNKMLGKAEELRGPFDVSYTSRADLESGNIRLLSRAAADTPDEVPLLKTYDQAYGLMTVNGLGDLSRYATLNAHFPHIQPLSMARFLDKAWKHE